MDSVPVWVLTATIEISLLCLSGLGLVTFMFWRKQRRLQAIVRAFQGEHLPQAPLAEPLPAVQAAEPPPLEITMTIDEAEAVATPVDTEAAVTAVQASSAEVDAPAAPPTSPESTEVAEAQATDHAVTEPEPVAESPASAMLTQDMLDALLAEVQQEADPEEVEEATRSEAQQSITTMMAENAAMEQQIVALQEKNVLLRQSVSQLLANASLPPEEQQELPVPEKTMQEMERGLTALQQARERVQQQLQAHCQLLGFSDQPQPAPDAGTATQNAALQAEVLQLQTTLEQQTTAYQRIQDEYERLLDEYQRVFENAAAAGSQTGGRG